MRAFYFLLTQANKIAQVRELEVGGMGARALLALLNCFADSCGLVIFKVTSLFLDASSQIFFGITVNNESLLQAFEK